MPKLIFLLIANILFFNSGWTQDINYAANLISPVLLQNANSVKRLSETKLVISDIGKATLYNKYAITILNKAGDHHADFSEYYDKFRNIKYVEGKLFNSLGVKIKSLKKSDLHDLSASDDNSFVDDNRIKTHNFQYNTYPYTIQYETAIELKGIFYLPAWIPVDAENMSVSVCKLTIETPVDYKLRYKMFNLAATPITTNSKSSVVYDWKIENVSAFKKPELSEEWYELTPAVFFAPSDFHIDNYNGNMETWAGLGKFVHTLNTGRDQLPVAVKNTIHQLTDSLKDERSKVKILYNYLQTNTRYISIQLGIGGWQTFPAEYVAQKGYGDCKALSNYMCALLKEAGIRSNNVLIKAGTNKRKLMVDFPSTQFNHVIACVPLRTDTIWLECTSQTLPMGYLSGFTADRDALLIDENGGKIVHTPKYGVNDNTQIRTTTATLNEAGDLSIQTVTFYKGMQQDRVHDVIKSLSKDKLNDYLRDEISLPSFDIIKHAYTEEISVPPVIKEELEIKANNYAQISGKRIFIVPNICTRSNTKLEATTERKSKVELNSEFNNEDSVTIVIPSGYHIETLPRSVSLENKFGKYITTTKVMDNKIIYYRKRVQINGVFSPESYSELAKYYSEIYKSDHSTVVLIKKD